MKKPYSSDGSLSVHNGLLGLDYTLDHFEFVKVRGSVCDDVFNISGGNAILIGGLGDDTFTIEQTAGDVLIRGGNGDDTLIFSYHDSLPAHRAGLEINAKRGFIFENFDPTKGSWDRTIEYRNIEHIEWHDPVKGTVETFDV